MLTPIFARLEPTTDAVALRYCRTVKRDCILYADQEATRRLAIWPWHYSNRPRRGQKSAMLNCARHRLVWLAPL